MLLAAEFRNRKPTLTETESTTANGKIRYYRILWRLLCISRAGRMVSAGNALASLCCALSKTDVFFGRSILWHLERDVFRHQHSDQLEA